MAFSPGHFAKQPYLPEPWSSSDNQTLDELLSQTDWERKFGLPLPRFLLDYENLTAEIPDALQSNHVRSSVATRWDSSGNLVEDASGTLRLQRDPKDQSVLGLLYEPQRTQLLGSPQDITTADWSETDATTNDPSLTDLNQSYYELTEDGDSTTHQIQTPYTRQSEGLPISHSCIVKPNGRSWIALFVEVYDDDASDEDFPHVFFDIKNGTIGTKKVSSKSASLIEASVGHLSNEWMRCNLSLVPDAGYAGRQYTLGLSDGDDNRDYQGDGTSGIHVMHAQAEVSREVTTPILQGGGVREADEVNYSLSYPDKSTGVAYSIKQEASGSYKDVGYTLLGTGGTSEKNHGVLMDGGGLNDLGSDGWKTVTRNSDDTDDAGDSPADEMIDRFQVRYPTPADVQAPVRVIRQLADFTQTLTSTQKSDLDSNYLTTP